MVSTAAKRLFQNRGKLEAARKKMVKSIKAKDGQYFGRVMKIGHTDKDGPTKVYATVLLICDKNGDIECQGEQGTVSIIVQDSKPDADWQFTEADMMARIMELWDKLGYDQFPETDEAFEEDVKALNEEKPYVKVGISTGKKGGKYLNINGLSDRDEILGLNAEIELPGDDSEVEGEEEGGEVEGSDETTDGGEGGEEGGEGGEAETVPFEEPAKPAPKAAPKPAPKAAPKAPAAAPAAAASRRRQR